MVSTCAEEDIQAVKAYLRTIREESPTLMLKGRNIAIHEKKYLQTFQMREKLAA